MSTYSLRLQNQIYREIHFSPVLRVVLPLYNDFLKLFGTGLWMGFRVHQLITEELLQIQGNPTEKLNWNLKMSIFVSPSLEKRMLISACQPWGHARRLCSKGWIDMHELLWEITSVGLLSKSKIQAWTNVLSDSSGNCAHSYYGLVCFRPWLYLWLLLSHSNKLLYIYESWYPHCKLTTVQEISPQKAQIPT